MKTNGSLSTNVKPAARNLGVTFHSDISFEKQITKVVQSRDPSFTELQKAKTSTHPTGIFTLFPLRN